MQSDKVIISLERHFVQYCSHDRAVVGWFATNVVVVLFGIGRFGFAKDSEM